MIDLLYITLILVFIIDISGFVDTVKRWVWKWVFKDRREYRDYDLKPFDCSLCASWWAGLLYIIITGFSWEMLAYVAFLSFLTPVFKDILTLIKDIMIKIIDEVYRIFQI